MNTLFEIIPVNLTVIIVALAICVVCVVLPCFIVYLEMWRRRNEINRKTEVALKAIENGVQIDPAFFTTSCSKKTPSTKGKVFGYLITGTLASFLGLAIIVVSVLFDATNDFLLIVGPVLLLLGFAYLAIYFIARKQFADEIKAEEEKLGKAE